MQVVTGDMVKTIEVIIMSRQAIVLEYTRLATHFQLDIQGGVLLQVIHGFSLKDLTIIQVF